MQVECLEFFQQASLEAVVDKGKLVERAERRWRECFYSDVQLEAPLTKQAEYRCRAPGGRREARMEGVMDVMQAARLFASAGSLTPGVGSTRRRGKRRRHRAGLAAAEAGPRTLTTTWSRPHQELQQV